MEPTFGAGTADGPAPDESGDWAALAGAAGVGGAGGAVGDAEAGFGWVVGSGTVAGGVVCMAVEIGETGEGIEMGGGFGTDATGAKMGGAEGGGKGGVGSEGAAGLGAGAAETGAAEIGFPDPGPADSAPVTGADDASLAGEGETGVAGTLADAGATYGTESDDFAAGGSTRATGPVFAGAFFRAVAGGTGFVPGGGFVFFGFIVMDPRAGGGERGPSRRTSQVHGNRREYAPDSTLLSPRSGASFDRSQRHSLTDPMLSQTREKSNDDPLAVAKSRAGSSG